MYDELSAQARPAALSGVPSIPWSEVVAWLQMRGHNLTRFEREAIILIDREFVAAMNANAKRLQDAEASKQKSED